MSAAGANYMTGLVGNVSIPVYCGSNVGWAGEIAAAAILSQAALGLSFVPRAQFPFAECSS